ncbi:hypothetical protein CAI21_13825 [Alkalilimnicola ehrlichii]|uniref:diguanylate cyclase n=1 Tax=Alkalilimnicola ehrlichii TaxID=351052 RepID=A0A3E0WNV7_9GAMM|nr:hypothetical protein CAI21_13825 [Alkalilimnicola ehrlichii]RFA34642.1 hypothetical protein CAL65_14865 [Alkalilimnicola ehrlichii]
MPIGMVVLTVAIYFWQQEQTAINEQLRKRERLFRAHNRIDGITQVCDAQYLRQQLDIELRFARQTGRPCALLMLDVDDFDRVNRNYGYLEGDRFCRH